MNEINNNTELKLLISKKSFEDTSERITKKLLKKIAEISEKEYGICFKDCYSNLLKVSQKDFIGLVRVFVILLPNPPLSDSSSPSLFLFSSKASFLR